MRPFSWQKHEKSQRTEFNSLFGEVLDWMLVPLFLVWPISIVVIHQLASGIANGPYDQALAENLKAISRQIKVSSDGVVVNFPSAARALLHADEQDAVYYQVIGLRGELIAGDREIPPVDPPANAVPDVVFFRDEETVNDDLRVAWQYVRAKATADAPFIMVQVAETRNKRRSLSSRIVGGVMLPQFALIPLAIVLVYIGLGRGLAPLNRLQRLIKRRRPGDLSPIPTKSLPEEVGPLIIAFNDMMARLAEILQAQQRFINNAAHQMRTPLTGLKMQADVALAETDPEQIRRSLRQIGESADRAAHLINQLLALARAEASFEKIHAVEAVDLEVLLRDVTRDMALQAMAKNIDFGFEATGWPLLIDGNPILLRELFRNLIDNAIKYTPEGGRVTVRTRAAKFAIVEVEDDGIGIPEEERSLVFERFHRVLGSGVEGSGLGLAIVREIAVLHRANVILRSNASGRGINASTIFRRRRAGMAPTPVSSVAPQQERLGVG